MNYHLSMLIIKLLCLFQNENERKDLENDNICNV